jgi:ribosomal-protein-alanine N-acetyltransferase
MDMNIYTEQMKTKIKIRLAKRKDRHAIKQINEKCLTEHYQMEYFEYILSSKNSFVLMDGSEYVGYILCDHIGHIVSFAILESHRGKGFGKNLLAECHANLLKNKIKQSTLNVRVSNERAIKLYKSVNYSVAETHKEYYDDKENAYYMRAVLCP